MFLLVNSKSAEAISKETRPFVLDEKDENGQKILILTKYRCVPFIITSVINICLKFWPWSGTVSVIPSLVSSGEHLFAIW